MYQGIAQQIVKGFQFAITRLLQRNVSEYVRYRDLLLKNPLKVFVSYDKDDEQKVRTLLYDRLCEEKRLDVWFDRESEIKDVPRDAKELWEPKLEAALEGADCVIVCLTKESVNNRSYFQKKEVPFILSTAQKPRELSIYLILVRLEECRIPKKYKSVEARDLFVPRGCEILAETIIRQAYEELKRKRGIKFAVKTTLFGP
jgi:hypothetical protein